MTFPADSSLMRTSVNGNGHHAHNGHSKKTLATNRIYHGDAKVLLRQVEPKSLALSCWSPPYFVGKSYEKNVTYLQWQELLKEVIRLHEPALKPGGFLVINIADILCFADPSLPRVQAETLGGNRLPIGRDEILSAMEEHPHANRYKIAEILGVSEQTVDRRLKNNNVRGGKSATQTRVKLVGCILEEAAYDAGLYLYDRRVWVKDPAWENSRWHTNSLRAVDEFEYLYFFWKPGITKVDRKRIGKREWAEWGSRAVWSIPSVRANDNHEAKFPPEIPRRLIRLLTDPGEVVMDCFVGSGTTAVEAIKLGRKYIGIDKEEQYAKLATSACRAVKFPLFALNGDTDEY